MSESLMRVRWISGIAVVAVGPNAPGEPMPPGSTLASLCAGNRGVVIDFAGYELISSAFLGYLIRAHHAAMTTRSRLCVCCPDGSSRQVLASVKLDRMLPIFATLAEAVADFGPPSG
ncbi:hypothetical protein VT84_23760 [Gemmata sp. SH-PL17]|uniref:STAS domain-containing protein n=1 Tax=Gemmata sp. SH-PL17 TaxID=1630693 RepID=UPI00078CA561|nr:STAS domain-containing protein [Gemmata sp. SH-PL17]AMV27437.1 hypothetical protein VT84_23760 [Gemmata sp. SH-PL17]